MAEAKAKPKKKPAKRKVGRPAFAITPEIIKQAEMLAAQGLTQEQIAQVIGCHISTLMDKKNQFIEFSEAIKRGKAKGLAQITNALFSKAKNGDTTSMIFYLKNRDRKGWGENQTDDDGEVKPLTINIDTKDARKNA
jgi:hypothetical protein